MDVGRLGVFVGLFALVSSVAQTPVPARRQFEVASIRMNNSGPPRVFVDPFAFLPGGRFIATNVTLTDVIVMAYKTRRIQMRGGPDWIDSERFNIAAKADEAEGEFKREQLVTMVQALVEDRFKLVLHRETEERTVYALVPGKTPPKLQPAKEGEQKAIVPGNRGEMKFQGMPLGGLVNTLANILHMPVVDGTGMTGTYDFTLDPLQLSDRTQPVTPDVWPDLVLAAVREQLGFKLEKQKAPLEITVIDHAEQPTDN
ncbi:MAG: TIGR03435 family protein [Bryobacteraceae bacterium]|jgi:uncharacterized protein (TIGR03435 family)